MASSAPHTIYVSTVTLVASIMFYCTSGLMDLRGEGIIAVLLHGHA